MYYRYYISSIMFFLIALNIKSQTNSKPALLNNDTSFYMYFDSGHKVSYQDEFKDLIDNYIVYVSFYIDKTGEVINLNLTKIPGTIIPSIVEKYIERLILKTGKKWKPQIKNHKATISDEILFKVGVSKKGRKIGDFGENYIAAARYSLDIEIPASPEVDRFIGNSNVHMILLTY